MYPRCKYVIFEIYSLAASRCFCFMILGPAEQITSPSLSSIFFLFYLDVLHFDFILFNVMFLSGVY